MSRNQELNRAPLIRISTITGLIVATVTTLSIVTMIFASQTFSAQAEEASRTQIQQAQPVTTTTLNNDNTQSVSVSLFSVATIGKQKDIQPISTAGADGSIALYRNQYLGLEPVESLVGYYKRTTIIQFNGQTTPNAAVTLTFDSRRPTNKMTKADEKGDWRIDVDVNELPAGDYTATLKTSVDNVASDTSVIAKFSVGTKKIMSNTTWMILMTVGIALIVLLVVINFWLFVQHRRAHR